MSTEGTPAPDEGKKPFPLTKLLGFEELTLTALCLAVLHLLFGPAGCAWLSYLGRRYYDAYGATFGIPKGALHFSTEQLASKGLEIALASIEGPLFYAPAVPTVYLLFIIYGYVKLLVEKYSKDQERARKLFYVDPPLRNLYAMLFWLVGLIVAGISLHAAAFTFPGKATATGVEVSNTEWEELASDESSCDLFGPKLIQGRVIVADDRAIFIAKRSGGVAQVPLERFESRHAASSASSCKKVREKN